MEPAFSIIVMVTTPAETGWAKPSRRPASAIAPRKGGTIRSMAVFLSFVFSVIRILPVLLRIRMLWFFGNSRAEQSATDVSKN
jgi:hypothetical protein